MKITIEPTAEIQRLNGEPARVWRGVDDHGTPVEALVRTVAPQTHDAAVAERYRAALHDAGFAERPAIALRNII